MSNIRDHLLAEATSAPLTQGRGNACASVKTLIQDKGCRDSEPLKGEALKPPENYFLPPLCLYSSMRKHHREPYDRSQPCP